MGKRSRKKYIAAVATLLIASLLCGAGLAYNHPVLNVEETPIYDAVSLREMCSDPKAAEEKYQGHDIVFAARYESSDKKSVTVADGSTTITATFSGKVPMGGVVKGDLVWIYGSVKIKPDGKNKVAISVNRVEKNERTPDMDYYFEDGTGYDRENDLKEISFEGGKVRFAVPISWETVKYNGSGTEESKTGNVFSDQIRVDSKCYYKLNRLGDSQSSMAECLVLFYFDSHKMLKYYDSDHDEMHKIEKAIIGNIVPKDKNKLKKLFGTAYHHFPYESVEASYGTKFEYYTTIGTDTEEYNAEFVFVPNGEEGVFVMLYLYGDSTAHKQDVMCMMRTIEVGGITAASGNY